MGRKTNKELIEDVRILRDRVAREKATAIKLAKEIKRTSKLLDEQLEENDRLLDTNNDCRKELDGLKEDVESATKQIEHQSKIMTDKGEVIVEIQTLLNMRNQQLRLISNMADMHNRI